MIGIQRRGRLIGQHQGRAANQGPGCGYPLLLAHAQPVGAPIPQRCIQTHGVEQLGFESVSGGSRNLRDNRPLQPEHLYKAVGLLLLGLLFYAFFEPVSRVLLAVYAATIVAVALNVVVALIPGPRTVISAGLGVLIFAALGAALWFGIPALADQVRGLASEIPRIRALIVQWSEWLQQRIGLDIEILGDSVMSNALEDTEILGRARTLGEALFLPLIILIGGIFAVGKPNERLLSPLLHAVPRERRDSFRDLFALLGDRLKGWVRGTLLAMIAVGVLTTIGLSIIGVRYAFLLGLISGVLEIVPFVGPWVAGALAVAVALLDDPTTALYVVILMLVIQQVESNLITPLVMSRAAQVHPFVTLFSLLFFGSFFGFLGVILAVPLVILVWTVVEVLWVDRAIGAHGDKIEPLVREE